MATAIFTQSMAAQAVDLFNPATRSGISTTYYGAYGRSGTAAAVTDTALGDEITDEARVATTITEAADDTIQYVWTVTATVAHLSTGTGAVEEAGVLDAATVGNLLTRATFPLINLEVGDSIEFTFTVQFSDVSE